MIFLFKIRINIEIMVVLWRIFFFFNIFKVGCVYFVFDCYVKVDMNL